MTNKHFVELLEIGHYARHQHCLAWVELLGHNECALVSVLPQGQVVTRNKQAVGHGPLQTSLSLQVVHARALSLIAPDTVAVGFV